MVWMLSGCTVQRSIVDDVDTDFYSRVYFTPGPECENNIIAHINSAETMRIAVYSITDPGIGVAIIAAYKRGADIRIISDRVQAKNRASLIDAFRAVGIPVALNRGYKIEHNKFAVFDNKTVLTGSYNWTTNASEYNSENCMFSNTNANEYNTRFNELWDKYVTR